METINTNSYVSWLGIKPTDMLTLGLKSLRLKFYRYLIRQIELQQN